MSELVMSKSQGGLGGYLYICGSVTVYETVMSGLRKAIYMHQASTQSTADSLLATAFAERRFMLDIFMTPRAIPNNTPTYPMSKLAAHTGHRKGSRMWIGVHGGVYDVTDFLPMHPGGTLIVAASAGLDATKTFDDLAHSSNPEVSSLLSKYRIGHLVSKPDFRCTEISYLYDMWYQYLRNTVESLTTLSFEANNILEDSKVWFSSSGLFNIGGVRKFYQFQSRLMQNGFSTLFGAKLQEIYLKLSYSLANALAPNVRLPDIIGTITRAQSSPDTTRAMKEVSEIGQFVCNNSKSARFHENGILRYAQTVTELDMKFLEQIRDEAGLGMDAFDLIASMDEPTSSKQVKLASYLLSVMERIAAHLEAYYASLAQESIYRPEIENNPARTRWNNVRRKIKDGSFFVLARPPNMSSSDGMSTGLRARQNGVEVDFAQIFASAQQTLQLNTRSLPSHQDYEPRTPRRLADAHTARAAQTLQAPSSFESQQQGNALRRMSTFITDNMTTIRRLSRLPAEYDFTQLMATYGKHPQAQDGNSKPASTTSSSSSHGLRVRAPPNTSPMLAPPPLRTRTQKMLPTQTQTPNATSLDQHLHHRHHQPLPRAKDISSPSSVPSLPRTASPSAAMNAAMAHLHRRQPPRSVTPLPASPRASLALSAAGSISSRSAGTRRNLSGDAGLVLPHGHPPTASLPALPTGLKALKLGASSTAEERMFQQLQERASQV